MTSSTVTSDLLSSSAFVDASVINEIRDLASSIASASAPNSNSLVSPTCLNASAPYSNSLVSPTASITCDVVGDYTNTVSLSPLYSLVVYL